ncbi:MAG: hypothetical protein P1Q69_12105 [Candidatus Thorarchaeota archaeon]|nr:hypothetical protein [Candidatus Thorarchaeota archaeon]
MDDKEILVHHIMGLDVSAIELLAKAVDTDEEDTRTLIEELVKEGKLEGYITEDGRRFFKTQVRVSDKPTILLVEEKVPEFLTYNTAPGRFIAIIGVIIDVIGFVSLSVSGGIQYFENLGLVLLLIGTIIAFSGCFWIGRRKTP